MASVSEIMQRDFLKLDASAKITEAIGKLQQEDERYVVIFDKKFKTTYKGILDRTLLIESKLNPNADIGNFVMHPPVVTGDTDVFKAAELMYNSYPCLLPVMKKDKVIGVVRSRDILALLPKMPDLAKLKVAEIAGKGLMVFEQGSRLGDALNEMRERHFSHAPIIDKLGRIISVFSLTDLFEKYLLNPEGKRQGFDRGSRLGKGSFTGNRSFQTAKNVMMDTPISDLASASIFTVSPTENLGRAVAEMFEHKISDLIIAQDRKPVGIVTTRDLLEVFFREKAPEYWGIQFFGCEALPGQLYDAVREQVAEFYEKIKRDYFKNIIYFLVHIKQYETKEGKNVKYSVHLRLAVPSKVFNAEYVHFNLNTAVSWAVKALNQQVQGFREKGKKFWTQTGKHGKRQELGKLKRAEIESRGKFIRSKLVKRK